MNNANSNNVVATLHRLDPPVGEDRDTHTIDHLLDEDFVRQFLLIDSDYIKSFKANYVLVSEIKLCVSIQTLVPVWSTR